MRDPDPIGGRAVDEELVIPHQHVRQGADDRDVDPGRERQRAPDAEVPELRGGFREDPLPRVEPRDHASFRLGRNDANPGSTPVVSIGIMARSDRVGRRVALGRRTIP